MIYCEVSGQNYNLMELTPTQLGVIEYALSRLEMNSEHKPEAEEILEAIEREII